MSFRILFRGLIAHVQDQNSTETRAVLVNHPGHAPMLMISTTDHRGDSGTPPTTVTSPSDEIWYDLTDHKARIVGVTRRRTRRVRGFDDHVPSLAEVLDDPNPANNTVMSAVHAGTHIPGGTFAYFNYENGTIEPTDCYPAAVEFVPPKSGDPECVVVSLLYAVEMDGDITLETEHLRTGALGTIRIGPNATIRVVNRAGRGNHFHGFNKICNTTRIRVPRPVQGKTCIDCVPIDDTRLTGMEQDEDHDHGAKGDAGRRAAPTVECTQTGFP